MMPMGMQQMGHNIMMQCSPTYRMQNMHKERGICESYSDMVCRVNRKYDPIVPVMPKYTIATPYIKTEKESKGYEDYLPKFPKYEPIKVKDSNDFILAILGKKKKKDYLSIYDPERYV